MDSFSTDIPTKALISYHSLERRLFMRLVCCVGTNPYLAMEIIAFWMWLEEIGHPIIILPLLELPGAALHPVAVEAKKCLTSLPRPPDFAARDSPVDLHFVTSHRDLALLGITAVLNTVCTKVFSDLLEACTSTLGKNLGRYLGNRTEGSSRITTENRFNDHHHHTTLDNSTTTLPQPTNISGLRERHQQEDLLLSYMEKAIHQLRRLQLESNPAVDHTFWNNSSSGVGSSSGSSSSDHSSSLMTATLMARAIYESLLNEARKHPTMVVNSNDHLMQSWCPPQRDVPRDERTLFVTFSNGYPLVEGDLRDFFTSGCLCWSWKEKCFGGVVDDKQVLTMAIKRDCDLFLRPGL